MTEYTGYEFVLRARIDSDLHRRLQVQAQRQDRTVSNLSRLILRHGLELLEKSGTEMSLGGYQANTHQEVKK